MKTADTKLNDQYTKEVKTFCIHILASKTLNYFKCGIGCHWCLDNNENLVGVITDGDIRRALSSSGNNIFDQTAKQIMSKEPKSISIDTLAITALEYMEKLDITSLFVFSKKSKKPEGIIHIHDLLKAGI